MEIIVSNNKDLVWDGWTVVSLKLIDSGLMSKNTVFINNRWYVQKRFELTEEGWDIPNKLVG
jgi:hypothetical protein